MINDIMVKVNFTKQIQNQGASIYGAKPDYYCVMTPTCIKSIQEYNKQHEDEGGLSNFDLTNTTDWNSSNIVNSDTTNEDSTFLGKLNGFGCECSGTNDKTNGNWNEINGISNTHS